LAKIKQDKAKSSVKKAKQFIYIAQAKNEQTRCKIGITDDPKRRLKEYNSTTGVSKDSTYQYLFTCEVKNMRTVENDISEKFSLFKEIKEREIYLYNPDVFNEYVNFIKEHKLFIKETFVKEESKKQITKIVKKITPTLASRDKTRKEILQKAQKVKNDEFYTRYEDIEKELSMYDKSIWKNKVVFCNCDDPVGNNENKTSAFALFFLKNFKNLQLKKLICTHYGSSQLDLYEQGSKGYVFTKEGYDSINNILNNSEKYKDYKNNKYDGSFDNPISIEILKKEADIVCTNPPFSRSIEYWNLIINSGKKFLIISNEANIITKAYIPYFIKELVWAGYNSVYWYLNPKKEIVRAAGRWYTNIKIKNRDTYKRLKIVPLKDIPDKYKKYDDSNILLVDGGYIPNNYKKAFAVSSNPLLNGILEKGYKIIEKDYAYVPVVKNKECFRRVLIKKI